MKKFLIAGAFLSTLAFQNAEAARVRITFSDGEYYEVFVANADCTQSEEHVNRRLQREGNPDGTYSVNCIDGMAPPSGGMNVRVENIEMETFLLDLNEKEGAKTNFAVLLRAQAKKSMKPIMGTKPAYFYLYSYKGLGLGTEETSLKTLPEIRFVQCDAKTDIAQLKKTLAERKEKGMASPILIESPVPINAIGGKAFKPKLGNITTSYLEVLLDKEPIKMQ